MQSPNTVKDLNICAEVLPYPAYSAIEYQLFPELKTKPMRGIKFKDVATGQVNKPPTTRRLNQIGITL